MQKVEIKEKKMRVHKRTREEREGGRENRDMEEGEREMLNFLQVLIQ